MSDDKPRPRRRIAGESSPADRAEKKPSPAPAPRKKPAVKRPPRPRAPHKPGAAADASLGETVGASIETDDAPVDDSAEVEAPSAETSSETGDSEDEHTRSPLLYPALVLAVGILIGGTVMAGWSWFGQQSSDGREEREVEAVTAATSAVESLFTFSDTTGEAWLQSVEPVMTERWRASEDFGQFAEGQAEPATDGIVQRIDDEGYIGDVSPVNAAAVECGQSCHADEVEVLVAFTYFGRLPTSIEPPVEYQFLVTMVRGDDGWLLDDVVDLNPPRPGEGQMPAPEGVDPDPEELLP